jgi:hypothetical protein
VLTLRSQISTSFEWEDARRLLSTLFHFICVPAAESRSVLFLSLLLELTIECRKPKYRPPRLSQIPGPYPRVDSCTDHHVAFRRMPVDVGNGAIMRTQYMLDRGFASQKEIPNQSVPLSVTFGSINMMLTIARWRWIQCIEHGWDEGSTERLRRPKCRLGA